MKTLYSLLILAVCLICVRNSHAQMRRLSLDADDNEVQKFSFYSPSEGYVAFTKWIGFTTDTGRSFTRKHITLSNVNYNGYPVNLTFGFGIKGVKAFNQDTIIVYGHYGLVPSILYSIDKGNSFKLIYHDRYDPWSFKSGITDMVFPQNNNIGYAVEADRILKTTNKGLSWSVVKLDVNRYFDYLEAVDNNNVFAFSTQYSTDKLYKTSNGGTTWAELPKPPGQLFYAHFLTAAKGWSIMKNDDQLGVMYYTSNGGATWTQKNDPDINPFYSWKFRFINDSTGYALAGPFRVFKTTDSGKVWQPLPRDNDFTYLNYAHNDIQILNANQLWAGGGHGLVEISTNGGGNPLPQAFFKIDTNGVASTSAVHLKNFSKPIYQYKWFKNGTLISTAYHTSFTHNIYTFRDTISLVVSDGTHSDTAVRYIDYPKVWITGFTPVTAAFGNTVTITGYNFSNAYQVNFGGVRASSFSTVSNTEIRAVVGGGASGAVEVFTSEGNASLPGFSFLGPPRVDLPVTLSDSILCKSEPVTVTIQNSETGVVYEFLLSFFGSALGTVTGNGGTVSMNTFPLTESGQYRIRATRPGVPGGYGFPKYLNILVEHPKARFTADGININPGEKITYAAQAGDAKDYYWTFYQDASLATATGVKAPAITYGTNGQKTLRLISVTSNGCRDTATSNAVFVYPKPTADASCFVNTMDSSGANSMVMDKVIPGKDDAIYVVGSTGNSTKLRSRVGTAKEFLPGNHSFFAKYTTNGVLKWAHYFKPGAGEFADAKTDSSGNIYLTGYAYSTRWLHFNNGDSTQIYFQPADTTYMGERMHGFIMKLNPDGKLLWQTLLYDHSELWQGYAVTAYGLRITVKNNHVMVIGGFPRNLSYVQNGVAKTLYEWPGYESGRSGNYAVLKIKDDGTLLWNARLRFQANNWHSLSDISVDKWGNSFLVGTYEESLSIRDAADVERVQLNGVVAYHKAFMVKYDSTGSIKWHNNFTSSYQYGDARLDKVEADEEGNTYVAGSMFNWGSPVTINITHNDGTILKDSLAAFALYKFDANGKRQWGVGSRYPYYGGSSALYVKNNDVYVAGTLSNNGVQVSSFLLSSTDGKNRNLVIGSGECFVVRYDSAGKFRRVYTSGQNPLAVSVSPSSLFGDSKGHFIMGGNGHSYIGGAINTIYNIVLPHPLKTGGDGFFAKMGPDFCKAALTADAGPDKIGCARDTVSIGSKASGDYYSWTSNPAGFTSDLSNPIPRPAVNTTYYLKVTNEEGETAYDTVSVTLKAAPIADAGPDTTICSSHSIRIGTPPIAGHSYQWYLLPASPFGSGTAQTYVSPVWNTTYYVRVVGPNGCPAYDTVTVSTVPNAAPVVRIETPNTTVCTGASVVFTALAQNIGSAPSYQWQVNGANVGTSSDKYSTDSLKNGDRVSLLITHNNRCVSSSMIVSNSITMMVTDKMTPAVTVTGNTTVMEGEFTTMSASVSNAGANFQLKWQDSTSTHGWQDLPSPPVFATYEYKPQTTGDKIRCVLTVSDLCVNVNVVTSAPQSFIVNKVTSIDPVPAAQYGLRYYPNPTQSTLIIDSLRVQDLWQQLDITSIDGKQTFLRMNVNNRTRIQIPVAGLSSGIHVAVLRNRNGLSVYIKFVKL